MGSGNSDFFVNPKGSVHGMRLDDTFLPHTWFHIAAVTGPQGMRFFLNGSLLRTNDFPGSFNAIAGSRNFIGAWNAGDVGGGINSFAGRIAEFRVWKVARTEAQIRDTMFQKLTGQEPDLAGLWNFADGSVNDASPAAHHGKLVGQAKVVEAALPSATALAPWSRLLVHVTDAAGAPLQNVTLRAEVNGTEVGRANSDSQGFTPLTVWTTAPAVDLVASGSNDLGGWQIAVPIMPYTERTNEWKLRRAITLAGRATALDGKTPQANLVVELVQPEKAESRKQKAEIDQSLSREAGSAATNRVLQLDGKSYVELPPNIFNELTEATVEGWVKWSSFGQYSRFFDFGQGGQLMGVYNFGETNTLAFETSLSNYTTLDQALAPERLRADEWVHVAAVSGPAGMKLYADGVLVGTHASTNSFATIGNGRNYLGLPNTHDFALPNWPKFTDAPFHGQIDEFRVWKVQRTAEQIRETMPKKLNGDEPGLFGLWNFDDPTSPGRDASPGAHHGKLMGHALTTNAALPAMVFGKITDASGKPLANASVEVHESGQPDRRIPANAVGEYAFTISSIAHCDLFVTTGELSAYRLGFQPTDESQRRLDWVLTEAGASAAVSSRRAEAPNRVLRLTGTNSFVELPANLLDDAREMTIEAWLKWDEFGFHPTAFDLGDRSRSLILAVGDNNNEAFGIQSGAAPIYPSFVARPGALGLHQWGHVAGVVTTNGLRLYLNGRLVATNAYTEPFFTNGPVQQALLGRSVLAELANLHGEMDEVRLWRTVRTPEQIRENMGRRLTGSEEGLVGLWNFDDPTNPGRDASPGAHHGKLMGQATVAKAALPAVVYGSITDASGKPLTNASVEVHESGQPDRRVTPNAAGEYAFTMAPAARCDLFVTTGELSAYRLGFQPTDESQRRLDWVLTEGVTASSSRREEALNRSPKSEVGSQKLSQSLLRSAATSFGPGTVVAAVLTDERGDFAFTNVPPGAYQVRAQIPGDRAWLDAGRVLFAGPDATEAERARLAKLELRLAPFNKGRWKKFGVLDGLRFNATGRNFLTSDGAIWNYAAGALARFDGREFVPLTSEQGLTAAPTSPMSACLDANGMFWMGTTEGLWRYRPTGGAPAARFSPPGLPTDVILEITTTSDGAIWWRTTSALVRYQGGQGTVFTNLYSWRPNLDPTQYQFLFPCHLAASGNRLWVTGPGLGLVRFDGTNQVRWTRQQGLPSDDTGTVAAGPDGEVWLADGTEGVVRFDGTNFIRLTQRDGLPPGTITCIRVAPDRRIWFGTARGTVARFDGRSFTCFDTSGYFTRGQPGAANRECWDIQIGPDGATWFGTSDRVWRFEEDTFRLYSTADGLPGNYVSSLLAAPGGALIGLSGTNVLVTCDGQRFRSNTLPIAASGLFPGPDGTIYAALTAMPSAPERLAILRGGSILSVLTNSAGQPGNAFTCLARAADGAIWAGTTSNGVVRFAGPNGGVTLLRTNGMLTNRVNAIHCDARGAVWMATEGGIVRNEGTNWTEFTTRNDASGGSVEVIESGRDGSVWFGSWQRGLARFDGKRINPIAPEPRDVRPA